VGRLRLWMCEVGHGLGLKLERTVNRDAWSDLILGMSSEPERGRDLIWGKRLTPTYHGRT
jgi:hypothetical protein